MRPPSTAGPGSGPRPATGAPRSILHVDMDAFFVSVELLRRPELRGRPVVVGGTGRRGVVAAASYEARAYGVHSAMATATARRLCPQAEYLQGDHRAYSEVSARVMAIFRSWTPLVEPLSLDEAFLDLTGTLRLHGPPAAAAARLRAQVREQEGLTCSVGVAPNKFLAKLASEAAKPRATPTGPVEGSGVHVVEAGRELAFLHPLPVTALWGVGRATLPRLQRLGVHTIGDLARLPADSLVAALGEATGRHLHELSHGRDDRPVVPDAEARSISHEETFAADLHTLDELRPEVVRLADAVAGRLRRHGVRARTVQLKLRYGDFTTVTRSRTLDAATDRGTELVDEVWRLLSQLPVERGVRLIGVGGSNLTSEEPARQLTLDDGAAGTDRAGEWDAANRAVDDVRSRFGGGVIGPARLARRRGARGGGGGGSSSGGLAHVPGGQQWGPDAEPLPEKAGADGAEGDAPR